MNKHFQFNLSKIRKRAKIARTVARCLLIEQDRKPLNQIRREYGEYRRTKGGALTEYFAHFLFRRNMVDPLSHVSSGERILIGDYFDTMDVSRVLRDKLIFQQTLDNVDGTRVPTQLGHTIGADEGNPAFVAADTSSRPLDGPDNLADAVTEMLVAAGPLGVFAKERCGGRGQGAFRLRLDPDGQLPSSTADRLWKAVRREDYLFQAVIDQHPAMAALSADTVNTLRITTLCLPGEDPRVASVWLKVGRKGGIADNAPGMLVVGVNESGRLSRLAGTKFEDGGDTFERHPESGVPFGDVVVPFFEEAIETALAAAAQIRRPPVVGWDVAIGTKGPLLLEGNTGSNYKSDELAHGIGFLAHPILGETLREALEEAIAARARKEAVA